MHIGDSLLNHALLLETDYQFTFYLFSISLSNTLTVIKILETRKGNIMLQNEVVYEESQKIFFNSLLEELMQEEGTQNNISSENQCDTFGSWFEADAC